MRDRLVRRGPGVAWEWGGARGAIGITAAQPNPCSSTTHTYVLLTHPPTTQRRTLLGPQGRMPVRKE